MPQPSSLQDVEEPSAIRAETDSSPIRAPSLKYKKAVIALSVTLAVVVAVAVAVPLSMNLTRKAEVHEQSAPPAYEKVELESKSLPEAYNGPLTGVDVSRISVVSPTNKITTATTRKPTMKPSKRPTSRPTKRNTSQLTIDCKSTEYRIGIKVVTDKGGKETGVKFSTKSNTGERLF